MKPPSGPVLDDNLARLLKYAYVPARPSQRFRAALWSEVEARLLAPDRAARHSVVTAVPRRWAVVATSLAAAAVLILAVPLAVQWVRASRSRGDVELSNARMRTAANGDFVALASDAATLAWETPFLELVTSAAGVRVVRDGRTRIDASAAAHLVGTIEGESLEIVLHAGSLRLEREAGAGSLRLSGEPGTSLELEDGELDARVVDRRLRVRVLRGTARCRDANGERVLGPADSWPREVALADPLAPGREPVGAPTSGVDDEAEPVSSLPAVEGRVVDAGSEQPVRRFHVHLLREQDYNSVTPPSSRGFDADDGAFRVEEDPVHRYEVFVSAEGYALWRYPELLDLSSELPRLNVRLERGVGVQGYVLDARSGAPIRGACVVSETDAPTKALDLALTADELPEWPAAVAFTGPDGGFELKHLSVANHSIRATAPGYGAGWLRLTRDALGTNERSILELAPGATVAGTVWLENGAPAARTQIVVAAVDVQGQRPCMSYAATEAASDGSYRVEDLPAGLSTVVVLGTAAEMGSRPPSVYPVQLTPGQAVTLDVGSPSPDGVRLFGIVRDAGGAPAPGVALSLGAEDEVDSDQNWIASGSDEDGRYEFRQLDPGTYLIYRTLGMGAGLVLIDRVEVPDWNELPHDLQLGDRELRGSVVDTAGRPVERALLALTRIEPDGTETFAGRLVTDRTGSFVFAPLGDATYRVLALATSGTLAPNATAPVSLADEWDEPRIVLGPGARLSLTVLGPDGRPVDRARVMPTDAGTGVGFRPDSVFTDARGHVVLDNLPADTLRIVVRTTANAPQFFDVALREGANELTLTLSPVSDSPDTDR